MSSISPQPGRVRHCRAWIPALRRTPIRFVQLTRSKSYVAQTGHRDADKS